MTDETQAEASPAATLALEVEFLTGRCVATDREDRAAPEWPPHPARLFAALAAAHYERKDDPTAESAGEAAERAALEWLERLGEPSLAVPSQTPRTTVSVFVPVNDSNDQYTVKAKGKITVFSKIEEGCELRRNRQERSFPTVVPDPPALHYLWHADPNDHRPALRRLAAEVTCLGHSSSLVRVAVVESPPPPRRCGRRAAARRPSGSCGYRPAAGWSSSTRPTDSRGG